MKTLDLTAALRAAQCIGMQDATIDFTAEGIRFDGLDPTKSILVEYRSAGGMPPLGPVNLEVAKTLKALDSFDEDVQVDRSPGRFTMAGDGAKRTVGVVAREQAVVPKMPALALTCSATVPFKALAKAVKEAAAVLGANIALPVSISSGGVLVAAAPEGSNDSMERLVAGPVTGPVPCRTHLDVERLGDVLKAFSDGPVTIRAAEGMPVLLEQAGLRIMLAPLDMHEP